MTVIYEAYMIGYTKDRPLDSCRLAGSVLRYFINPQGPRRMDVYELVIHLLRLGAFRGQGKFSKI